MPSEEAQDVSRVAVTSTTGQRSSGHLAAPGWPSDLEPSAIGHRHGTSLWANHRGRGACVPALKFRCDREGSQRKGQGQNRTGEIPPSGIVGGLVETSVLGEPD